MKKLRSNGFRCAVDCKLQMRSKKATRNAALTSRMANFFSNLLVFLHKSNPSICHSAIVSWLKKERVRQFRNTPAGIMIALFCSVLFS